MLSEIQHSGGNDIDEFLDDFFRISEYRVEGQCKGFCGSAFKGNKKICGANCRNLGNYSPEELFNLSEDLKQKLLEKGVNINSEEVKVKIAKAINKALGY